MELSEIVIAGTLKADGTLELDEKPKLPAGRVTVVLRQTMDAEVPTDDPFWQRMRKMWAIPKTGESEVGGPTGSLEVVRTMREEWHDHQQAIERLQNENRGPTETDGKAKP